MTHSPLFPGRPELLNHPLWRGGRRGRDVWWHWWLRRPTFWFPVQTHHLAWESGAKRAHRGERWRYLWSLTRWGISSCNYLPLVSEILDLVEECTFENSRGSQISEGENIGEFRGASMIPSTVLPPSGSKLDRLGSFFHLCHVKSLIIHM